MYRFFPLFLTFLFIGCSPRYIIKNEYIATANTSQACIDNCAFVRQGCQDRCQQNYQYCLNDAYNKARAVEAEEQRSYDIAYSRYRMDMMQYDMAFHRWQRDYDHYSRDLSYFQHKCESGKDGYACQRQDELRRILGHIRRERPSEPWVPVRPTFEQILVNQQSFCTTNCGCEQGYDNCFAGCGGVVIPHKICVENCD